MRTWYDMNKCTHMHVHAHTPLSEAKPGEEKQLLHTP